jgi:lipopolysaccharide export LptBFGC system permease protein LptF
LSKQNNMTKHRDKSKKFIDGVFIKSKKSKSELLIDLENQIEKWKDEYRNLSYKNVFDMEEDELYRKHYLNELISYAELKLSKK